MATVGVKWLTNTNTNSQQVAAHSVTKKISRRNIGAGKPHPTVTFSAVYRPILDKKSRVTEV